MAKLHELLAAEKTVTKSWDTLADETLIKFGKEQFFQGHTKTLTMLVDSPQNKAIEDAARDERNLPTNVLDTLQYAFALFVKAEDLQYQKNKTNAMAIATLTFRGVVVAEGIPIDELLGLESRLGKIRAVYMAMPTLDASKAWSTDSNLSCWVAPPEVTTKTEKTMVPVVLAPATDKHPAQVKESTRDETVGKFTMIRRSGAVTAVQKAEMILAVDELISEVKMARQRANDVAVSSAQIGQKIVDILLAPLQT